MLSDMSDNISGTLAGPAFFGIIDAIAGRP